MSEITRSLGPALKRALLLRGGNNPLDFDGRVLLAMQLGDLDRLPYLEDDTFSKGLTISPVVGQHPWFVCVPPAGSLLVLDFFWVTSGAVQFVNLQLGVQGGFPGVAATTVQQAGDFNVPANLNRLAPGTWTAGTSAVVPLVSDSVWRGVVPAANGQLGPIAGPWVIDDKHQLAINGQTANSELTFSVYGRLIRAQ